MFHEILKTLAYFDVFDYPLTAVEVYKFLWRSESFENGHCEERSDEVNSANHAEIAALPSVARNDGGMLGLVVEALEQMENVRQIGRRFGYFCLPGREALVETRWQRYLVAEPKYKIALRVARLLRLVPNVQLVAVCNNLAYNNARRESDIDLFIVTAPQRIWLTRLLVTVVVHALGLRRHGSKVTDRCCLSFYVTADHTDLAPLALTPEDPYLYYWLATLAIVYARPGAAQDFWQANAWVRQVLPNFRPRMMNARRTVRSSPWTMRLWRAGEWCNKLAKKIQLAKMAHRERSRPRGVGVVISDEMLKFHEDDRRESYRQCWQDRLQKFLPLQEVLPLTKGE